MKATGLLVSAVLAPAVAQSLQGDCRVDNCAQAVIGTQRGGNADLAHADCFSFLKTNTVMAPLTM
jgi:hypothetical protein